MKRLVSIILLLCFVPQVFCADVIVTKKNRKYHGTVVAKNEKGFVIKTVEGSFVVVPEDHVSKIIRGNLVYDLEEKMKYHLEVRRPFLPFLVLGLATAAYSVKKYQDYRTHRDQAEEEKIGPEYTNLSDQSKKDLAWCIVSGLFSAGSVYVALRPMEVKVPIGRISLSSTSTGVTLALHF